LTHARPAPGLLLALLLLGQSPGALAQAAATPPARQLNEVMASRLAQLTGVPVTIRKLLFNPFKARFEGAGLRAGEAKRPLVRVDAFTVKIGLPVGGVTPLAITADGVAVQGAVGNVALAGTVTLKGARVARVNMGGAARIAFEGKRGGVLTGKVGLRGKGLRRLRLTGNLKGDARLPRMKGRVAMPKRVKVRLKVKLGPRRLGGTLRRWRIR